MAFKSAQEYISEKYNGKFILQNDGDTADVIFLYRSPKDVLVADVHYIKSDSYSGYVHCCEDGCPACENHIRVQTKMFVPMYVLNINGEPVGKILFWDRTPRFEPQLQTSVFSKCSDPSEIVWKIIRRGASGDINTRYQITAIANNNIKSYDDVLKENKTKMPDCYEIICKDLDKSAMSEMINSRTNQNPNVNTETQGYTATPRVSPSLNNSSDFDMYNELDEELNKGVRF